MTAFRSAAAWIMAMGCAVLINSAEARIGLVTLPGRDSVQLTIYNSVDLTLVRETRHLTFRRGLNRLEFSWANTLIDPTSVELRVVTRSDEVDVLDVSFPPRVANTLEWRIHSDVADEIQIEIQYFTSGITWSADYLAEVNQMEDRLNLHGNVRITNQSGEDYENAEIRLIVGVVRLVEQIADLARRGERELAENMRGMLTTRADLLLRRESQLGLGKAVAAKEQRQRDITKEALSEYFLYSIEGRDTIPTGWSKRLPSLRGDAIPVTSFYKFEQETFGPGVMRHFRFTNSITARLGTEPLPDGAVTAMRLGPGDRLYAFVGKTAIKYVPVDEQVELQLGSDPEVTVEPRLMNWEKIEVSFDGDGNVSGQTVRQTWRIQVQNSRAIPVALDVRRSFSGDWSIETAAAHERLDARKIRFLFTLQPGEQREIDYTVTQREGTNARR